MSPPNDTAHALRDATVARLRSTRPRSRLLEGSALLLALLGAGAWFSTTLRGDSDLFSPRRRANLQRFLTEEALPPPLRESSDAGASLAGWLSELFTTRGAHAVLQTLWIALVAMALAGAFAAFVAPVATRTLMRAEPFAGAAPGRRIDPLRWLCALVRVGLVCLRAIPEYVWAFLLLALFGPGAWPAILALALHNAGILGRLTSESLESLDARPMRALRKLGATRGQIAWAALRPLAFGRYLLFFFYRLETCVREATVLGMLGVVSLGYWVQDARARQLYDELLFFVALGGLLVLCIDGASNAARAWIRRST